jgi:hypothetical protein
MEALDAEVTRYAIDEQDGRAHPVNRTDASLLELISCLSVFKKALFRYFKRHPRPTNCALGQNSWQQNRMQSRYRISSLFRHR